VTRRRYLLIALLLGGMVPVTLLTSVGADQAPFGRQAQAQRGGRPGEGGLAKPLSQEYRRPHGGGQTRQALERPVSTL
jgi:hypothetical protein